VRLSTIAVVFALSPCLVTGQNVEQELKKLETQWADALVKKDLTVIDRILADDFTNTGTEGDFLTNVLPIGRRCTLLRRSRRREDPRLRRHCSSHLHG
jgi:hypothetical protein